MINAEELEICRRRGHSIGTPLDSNWMQCTYCGMWLRTKPVIEEREDDPPKDEISIVNSVAAKRSRP